MDGWHLVAGAIAVWLGISTGHAWAQARATAQFHVGDHVEYSSNAACLGTPYATPMKGTIQEANTDTRMNYVIQTDPLPNQAPRTMAVPLDHQKCGIRLIGGAAPQVQTDKLRVDQFNTVLADRPLLDCKNMKATGKNGSPISEDAARKIIACLWEKPADPGLDGAVRADVSSVTIGAPRRWVLYRDPDGGGDSTMVYPVRATWTTKTFYRYRNLEVADQQGEFACIVDSFHTWRCELHAGPSSKGTTREVLVKP